MHMSRGAQREFIAAVRIAIALAATPLVPGCIGPGNRQTIRFDLSPGPVGVAVTERRSYFLWGLVPTTRTDVLEKCPTGVVAIRDAPGEKGALAWMPTLGLWSSRSKTYLCRAEARGALP